MPSRSNPEKTRILLVDDEPDITRILKRALDAKGFQVDAFNDPKAALAKCKPDLYDVFILDILMPGMNGFDLCRELLKVDGKAKICFLSAFEIFPEAEKVFPILGVNRFIKKPVLPSELIKQIHVLLNDGG